MPNKNYKRLGLKSGTRGEPVAPVIKPVNHKPLGATPETAAKLQSDFLDKLVRDGPENGGIDNPTFEALFEIEEAHTVVSKLTAARASSVEMVGGGDPNDMSPSEDRTWTVWGIWAVRFYKRTGIAGTRVAELIKARHPVDATFVGYYKTAAGLWDQANRDFDKGLRMVDVLTPSP